MTLHDKMMQDPEFARLYAQEDLLQDTAEKILAWMECSDVDRAELARRIESSRSYITQLLSGARNMTLRTLADICTALDARAEITIVPDVLHVHGQTMSLERADSVAHVQAPRKLEVKGTARLGAGAELAA